MFAASSVGVRVALAGSKRAMFSSTPQRLTRRAKVVVVGSGRMGHIRSSLIYANPKFELCGIVDTNFDSAAAMADTFRVRFIIDASTKQCQDVTHR